MSYADDDLVQAYLDITQVSDTARTRPWLQPVFMGERVPPFPADKPLPSVPRHPNYVSTAWERRRS